MSRAKAIPMDGLANAIMEELKKYSQESSDKLKEGLQKVAKETAKELKGSSPSKTGKYSKGWKDKVQFQSADDIRIVVHNKAKPGLTHLLEHGHAKVNGGRVAARPHIAAAEQTMMEKAIKIAEDAYGK